MSETDNCVFCRVVAGELPSRKVYEDEGFIGIIDISPIAPGHILIIPKTHYRYVWDVPETEYEHYMSVVRKMALVLKGLFGTDIISSKIMGEEVPHAHVWIFPYPSFAQGDKNDLDGNAHKIRSALT